MAKIQKNVDLAPFNTFQVPCTAKNFLEIDDLSDLGKFENTFILGAGANTLFVKKEIDFVIKNNLRGRKQISDGLFEVASGEDWNEFVMWAVDNGWSGIENLAYIPGTVGAAPVQNIAAYGQTAGEVIHTVRTIDGQELTNSDCKFYYRDSIFKHELRNKAFITSVVFKLSKTNHFATDYYSRYESLKTYLPQNPTPKTVTEAVIKIRQDKLPDWRITPTAGSVFKNPFVSKKCYEELAKEITELQMYPINHMLYPNPNDPVFKMTDMVKIPAARLLDELGWKGKKIGNVATHPKHALIVINCGGATGQEIYGYLQLMKLDIKKHYDIDLEEEINIL